jgi:hypothetical protein
MTHGSIYRAVENIAKLTRRDAGALADQMIDTTIDALRRNPEIPARSFAEWSLILAGLRPRIAEQIADLIDGHADLDEVLTTIEALGEWAP